MNKNGVSLAELLAVVVIMGIIAAIAVPLVSGLIDETRKDAVYGDALAIVDAARLYCITNEDTRFCEGRTPVDLAHDELADSGWGYGVNIVAPNFREYISEDLSRNTLTYAEAYVIKSGDDFYVKLVTQGEGDLVGTGAPQRWGGRYYYGDNSDINSNFSNTNYLLNMANNPYEITSASICHTPTNGGGKYCGIVA